MTRRQEQADGRTDRLTDGHTNRKLLLLRLLAGLFVAADDGDVSEKPEALLGLASEVAIGGSTK